MSTARPSHALKVRPAGALPIDARDEGPAKGTRHDTQTAARQARREWVVNVMNLIAWLAMTLLVVWLVLRIALAVTSGALHLLWIAAVVMFVVWVFGRFRGAKAR